MTRARSSTSWPARAERVGRAGRRLPSPSTTSGDVARAWAGRPSDIPAAADRSSGPAVVLRHPVAARPAAGPRPADPRRRRRAGLGSVAAEHVLSPAAADAALTATDYTLPTPLAPVSLRMRCEGAGDESRPRRVPPALAGGDAAGGSVGQLDDIRQARADLRRSHRRRAVLVGRSALHAPAADRSGCSIAAPPRGRTARSLRDTVRRAGCCWSPAPATVWWALASAVVGGTPPTEVRLPDARRRDRRGAGGIGRWRPSARLGLRFGASGAPPERGWRRSIAAQLACGRHVGGLRW